jgi:hypothetical protein
MKTCVFSEVETEILNIVYLRFVLQIEKVGSDVLSKSVAFIEILLCTFHLREVNTMLDDNTNIISKGIDFNGMNWIELAKFRKMAGFELVVLDFRVLMSGTSKTS